MCRTSAKICCGAPSLRSGFAAKSSVAVERGDVFLPEDAAWLGDFFNEVLGFPGTRHDDQVDALSQSINRADTRWKRLCQTGGIGEYGIVAAGQIVHMVGVDAWPRDEDASV